MLKPNGRCSYVNWNWNLGRILADEMEVGRLLQTEKIFFSECSEVRIDPVIRSSMWQVLKKHKSLGRTVVEWDIMLKIK